MFLEGPASIVALKNKAGGDRERERREGEMEMFLEGPASIVALKNKAGGERERERK